MKKILCVAKREFLATVTTKAFIIGMFLTPAMIGVFLLIFRGWSTEPHRR